MRVKIGFLLAFFLIPVSAAAQSLDEWAGRIQAALRKGNKDQAIDLANEAVKAHPKSAISYEIRGSVYQVLRKHAEAVSDFTEAIKIDPRFANAYQQRGSEQFKQGKIGESIADFDRFLELHPEEKPGHWQRGISLYYLGRFEDGKNQFQAYEQKDTNDVENAVWHYLCNARLNGVDKARREILKIGQDRRIPMMQVYSLFQGKIKPADVLAAAEAGEVDAEIRQRQLFYAHLYLGLYFEVLEQPEKAKEHLALAATKYRIGHYMGDVAHVHHQMLKR